MKKHVRFNGETGLTLLEVTFAAGILATAFALLLTSMMSMSVVRRGSETRQVAVTHLSSILEEVHDASFAELMSYVPPAFEGWEGNETLVIECFNSEGQAFVLPLTSDLSVNLMEGELPNPLEVKATLSWGNDWGPSFTVSASTFCSR